MIGSKNIKDEFIALLKQYPEILKAIPILVAKRMNSNKDVIIIKDTEKDYYFDFRKKDYSVEEYANFMEKTGLFDLLQNHIVSNLLDYVTGVEVGLDSNGRKNRSGQAMENIVENYLINAGFIRNVHYFKEIIQDEVEEMFGVDLSAITNNGQTTKRFDFVLKRDEIVFLIEVNFYSSGGSKLNETARSYKMLAEETKQIDGVEFVWFTDGKGWSSAKNNLKETFDVLPNLYNINDLKNGAFNNLVESIS